MASMFPLPQATSYLCLASLLAGCYMYFGAVLNSDAQHCSKDGTSITDKPNDSLYQAVLEKRLQALELQQQILTKLVMDNHIDSSLLDSTMADIANGLTQLALNDLIIGQSQNHTIGLINDLSSLINDL